MMFLMFAVNLCFSQVTKEENLEKYGQTPAEQYSRKADELNAGVYYFMINNYSRKLIITD